MLARVPKVVQVIFELLGGRVGHANVDQTRHDSLHHRVVALDPAILQGQVEDLDGRLPVAIGEELL